MQTVHFCFSYLEKAKVGYPIAGPLQDMFRTSLTEYGIPIPDELQRMLEPSRPLTPDELLDACTRATYKAPIPQFLSNAASDIARDFAMGWQQLPPQVRAAGEQSRGRSGSNRMEISAMLNP